MGIIHKNVIEDYWSDDDGIFCTSEISDIMPYSKFSFIYKIYISQIKQIQLNMKKYKYYMMK